MYAYIKGTLEHKGMDYVVVEAGGVGYHIGVGVRTLSSLPASGQSVRVYTYLAVREDAMLLYGFASPEEKAMFEKLITVSGVGPKAAMSILGSLSVADIAIALVTNDARAFTKAPGVGKRIAERLVLELKERVSQNELTSADASVPLPSGGGMQTEAVAALMALGYSSPEAARAVSKAQGDTVEEIIIGALRLMDVR